MKEMIREVAPLDQLWVVAEVLYAIILGSFIGAERRKADKPAGTRTHALVAGAAALVTAISAAAVEAAGIGDPTRGLHAVITGIGFLGAGAIMTPNGGNGSLTGLTTAASVFFTAAIGGAVASGFALTATIATVSAYVVLRVFGRRRYLREHPQDDQLGKSPRDVPPPH
jgi:putative Mg2+ transporter-C (MgtC) family protein